MPVSSNRYLLFAAVWTATSSIAAAQSGSAAPGGATNAAAPGGATSSVAPSGAAPQAAPGNLLNRPRLERCRRKPRPARFHPRLHGWCPWFHPLDGRHGGGGATPGTVSPPSTSSGQAGSMIGQPNVSSRSPATAPAFDAVQGHATTLGVNFATDGNGLRLNGVVGDSFAQQAGLMVGDTIVGVNGQTVKTQAELQTMMQRAFSANAPLSIFVRRNGQIQSIGIPPSQLDGGKRDDGNECRREPDCVSRLYRRCEFLDRRSQWRDQVGGRRQRVAGIASARQQLGCQCRVTGQRSNHGRQRSSCRFRPSSLVAAAIRPRTKHVRTDYVNRDGVIRTLTVNRPAGFIKLLAALCG